MGHEDEKAEKAIAHKIKEAINVLNVTLQQAKELNMEISIGYDNPDKRRNGEINEGGTFSITKLSKTVIENYE